MKHFFTALIVCMCVCLTALGAQAIEIRTLTFEDAGTSNTWASLIDSPQYGGSLLYGDIVYSWVDSGNTGLGSEIPENWGTRKYSGGGHAISNYWNGNLAEGTYENQLSVYTPDNTGSGVNGAGHNGSNNFCVHYGYRDNSGYSASNLPSFHFASSEEHKISHMWINNTTYFVNCALNGNSFTSKLGENDSVCVQATGYNAAGAVTGTSSFRLAKGSDCVQAWRRWDLSSLGNVQKVEFNVTGNVSNDYGFSQPAYFAYDDVAVILNPATSASDSSYKMPMREVASSTDSDGEEKTMNVEIQFGSWEFALSGDVPEGVSYSYDGPDADDIIWGRLSSGQSNCMTITGMPSNAKITGITALVYSEQEGKSTLEAFVGDEQFASLSCYGIWVHDGEGVQIVDEDPVDLVMSNEPYCTDNIYLKCHCLASSFDIENYYIHYVLDDTTTSGIADVEVADGADDGAWYTLQGIRVASPTAKGIYIHNGKKVAVR